VTASVYLCPHRSPRVLRAAEPGARVLAACQAPSRQVVRRRPWREEAASLPRLGRGVRAAPPRQDGAPSAVPSACLPAAACQRRRRSPDAWRRDRIASGAVCCQPSAAERRPKLGRQRGSSARSPIERRGAIPAMGWPVLLIIRFGDEGATMYVPCPCALVCSGAFGPFLPFAAGAFASSLLSFDHNQNSLVLVLRTRSVLVIV